MDFLVLTVKNSIKWQLSKYVAFPLIFMTAPVGGISLSPANEVDTEVQRGKVARNAEEAGVSPSA